MANAALSALVNQSLTAQVRAHFGIKQWELAAFLNISRPLLGMVELRQRQLPTQALLRLLPLVQHLPTTPVAGTPAEPSPAPGGGAPGERLEDPALRHRLITCQYDAERLRRELAFSVGRAEAAARYVAVVPALRAAAALPAELTTPAAEAHARQWIEDQRQEAERVLHTHHPTTRTVREVRLLALEWEVAEIQRRLPPVA